MRQLLTLCGLLLVSAFATAQIFNPVKWSFSAHHISGDEYNVLFDAKMDRGWSIYSQFIADGGPIPTEFTFEDDAHYERIGEVTESDNAVKSYDRIFEMVLIKFTGTARFTQRIKVKDASRPVTGYLTFMTCDDERCLPPKDVDFEITLPPPQSKGSGDAQNEKAADIALADTEQPVVPVEGVVSDARAVTVPVEGIGLTGIFDASGHSGVLTPVTWSFRHENLEEGRYMLIAEAKMDDGWYIYSQHIDDDKPGPVPTAFYFDAHDDVRLVGEVAESGPKRIRDRDQFFDMVLVKYRERVVFEQIVEAPSGAVITGELEFMTCNNEMCLPPEFVSFAFDLSRPAGIPYTRDNAIARATITDGNVIDQSVPSIQASFRTPVGDCGADETARGAGLFWTFILGFGGGLLALLTPCVFPMIPLTVSFFLKDTRRKGWVNGSIYGVSIIVIYVAIGLLITAFFGATALNQLSTNWIANTLFFLIFLIFAFSFFGFFELTLPSSWSTKSDRLADRGGLIGIFFMAFTLALVSFSCTGPIIGTALVESASNAMGPFVVMLGFSTALALPFGLFAAFPAWLNSMPRSGGWMNSVKVIIGFLELALAFKFLSVADMTSHWNFLKYDLFLLIWVLIAAGMALYLFGLIRFPHDSKLKRLSVPRLSLAVVMSALALYMATGFLYSERTGTYNSLPMLSGLAPPAHYNFLRPVSDPDPEIRSRFPSYSKCANNLDCFHDYYEGMAYAQEVSKPVFLDFTGYGCVNCRKTEEHIWVDDRVWNRLKNDFVMISLYVDDRTPLDSILISGPRQERLRNVGNRWADFQIVNFEQNSQPLYVIMSPQGQVLANPRGYREGVQGYVAFLECGLEVYEHTAGLFGQRTD